MKNSSVVLVNEYENIQFECYVDSYPSSIIFWSFNDEILSKNENILLRNNISLKYDIGLYYCHAEHPRFGLFNRTIRLALKNPPEFYENNLLYSINLGQTVEMICRISNHIPTKVSFRFSFV